MSFICLNCFKIIVQGKYSRLKDSNFCLFYTLYFPSAEIWDVGGREGGPDEWGTETEDCHRPGPGEGPQDSPAGRGHLSPGHWERVSGPGGPRQGEVPSSGIPPPIYNIMYVTVQLYRRRP